MTDIEFIMLYFVLTTVILGFIAAFAWSVRLRHKGESFTLEQSLGKTHDASRLTLGCDVCGAWTPQDPCFECETWAEVVICHYEGKLPSFQLSIREHTRLVNAAGW
jgi:hypothetical protein